MIVSNSLKGKINIHCFSSIPTSSSCSVDSSIFVIGHYVGSSFRRCFETPIFSNISHLKKLHKKTYPNYKPVVLCLSVSVTCLL